MRLGYLSLGGFFVAFMSGNSTLLGIAAAQQIGGRVELAAGLVAAFLVGVMAGTWVGRWRRLERAPAVLLLVSVLLAVAALLHGRGVALPGAVVTALAMGAVNTVFQREGQAGIGLTYMTGTLVRLGQRLADAVTGGSWDAVLPDVLLWGGMVAGATLGAFAYSWLGLGGVWIAAGVSLVMAGVAKVGLR